MKMDCEISETEAASAVLLNDEVCSTQSITVPLTIDEDKSHLVGCPPSPPTHETLLAENAVFVQTENGLLLSMSDCMGGLSYNSLSSLGPGDLQEGRAYSFLVACGQDGGINPPHVSDFDTRALDKFPDISSDGLTFDTPTTECSTSEFPTTEGDKLRSSLHFSTDSLSVMSPQSQHIELINVDNILPTTEPSDPLHTSMGALEPVESEPVNVIEVPSYNGPTKRCGWPKGKKRKHPDIDKPRPPATAFVAFLTKRGKEIRKSTPGLHFSDVNKIIGGEWSTMNRDDKMKYVEQSRKDKLRYIDELKNFEKSEKYQNFLKRKQIKAAASVPDGGVDSVGGDQFSDGKTPRVPVLSDLHCSLCNQFFSSAHNKTEHMFGNKHLTNLADQVQKGEEELKIQTQETSNMSSSVPGSTNGVVQCDELDTLDISAFTLKFYEKNLERELEIHQLHKCHKDALETYTQQYKKIQVLKDEKAKLEETIANLKSGTLSLVTNINSLTMLPRLFGSLLDL